MKNNIETIGKITKKELLGAIEKDLAGGFMALENRHPFPGYHGNTIPDFHELIPDSIFIITKQEYNEENLIRTSHKIRKKFKKKFDAAPGQINVFNEMVPCIRVKFLKSYSDIAPLLSLFNEHGIQFVKYKKVKPSEGLITINKFFELEILDPGMYLDQEDTDMCYFQIPMHINWDTFERITLDMKRNMDDNKFDAALAVIFRKNCAIDCVRVYGHRINREKINTIKDRYLKEIKKLKK